MKPHHCTRCSNRVFFENTGTAGSPSFAAPVAPPTDLPANGAIAFVDIDGDGDFDVFVGGGPDGSTLFLANQGTAQSAAFASPVANPFGDIAVRSGGVIRAPSAVVLPGLVDQITGR